MLKIIVSKTEDAKSLLKKIEAAKSSAITLVIPKDSRFGDEVANYHALREVATEMDKEIYIESVDEDVLALAKANGWEAIHPLFQGSRKGSISDIVSSKQTAKTLQHSHKSLDDADEINAHSELKDGNKNAFHVGVKDSTEDSGDVLPEDLLDDVGRDLGDFGGREAGERAIENGGERLRGDTGRIFDRKVQLQRAVRLLVRPDVRFGFAMRDEMFLPERPRRHRRRHFPVQVRVAEQQTRAVGRVREGRERLERVVQFVQHGART